MSTCFMKGAGGPFLIDIDYIDYRQNVKTKLLLILLYRQFSCIEIGWMCNVYVHIQYYNLFIVIIHSVVIQVIIDNIMYAHIHTRSRTRAPHIACRPWQIMLA